MYADDTVIYRMNENIETAEIELQLVLIKDRQQEARAVLMESHYIGDFHMPLEPKYMYYIPLTILLSGLFIDIKHVKITGSETKRA